MPGLHAAEDHVEDVEDFLDAHDELDHLRVRRRGSAIIIESGPKKDRSAHARLQRISAQHWHLEIADHTGSWEPTPYTGTLESLLTQLLSEFPWVLAPRA